MVINKRKYTPGCTKFQSNGKVVSNAVEISNKFNKFFANVVSTLASGITPTNKIPSDYMTSNKVLFVVSSVTETEIEKNNWQFKRKLIWLGWAKASNNEIYQTKYHNSFGTHKQSVIPNRGTSDWTKNSECGANIQVWWWNNFHKLQTSIYFTSFF